ncbi:MAG TPA: pantoate--beta-alanine ligase, partial [Thermoanaerobaculia bacterium]|nr:pantoate--beta-alanine ligase [Thermoanaerobaculia bacterium]
MRTVEAAGELRAAVDRWREAGDRIAFVPTMGALHEGHLSLVRRAREVADRVVASIFVNPAQFNRAADLERYPRTPEADARLLAEAGCHLLFLPDEALLYPPEHATWVVPGGPAEGLEGAHRPGHFRGVATVVAKLFGLVGPDVAVFGEKDAQQLAVVRRMVADLHLPVEVVPGPTVREEDGLAMSSRNALLSPEERRAAAVLHRALRHAEAAIREGCVDGSAATVRRLLRETLASEPRARVDYADVVDAETFRPVERLAGELI